MKRANGEGSVEVLPDGRARIRVVDGKNRRQVGPIWPTAQRAHEVLAAMNEAKRSGLIEPAATLTLATLGSDWLDVREMEGSRRRAVVKSIRMERSVWGRHVMGSELAAMPISAIDDAAVLAFSRWLRKRTCVVAAKGKAGLRVEPTSRPLSASMQRTALRLVRQVLKAHGSNAADAVTVAPGAVSRDLSEDWLRKEEIARLLECQALSLRNRTVYACAIGLGLRLDDIKAITLDRVELDTQVPGPAVRVLVGKSERWHRVPVMPWLVPWLRAHIATLPKRATYLFPAPDGKRYGVSYDFGWAVKKERGRNDRASALATAGIARKIRFHDLRGTTATHLALGTWGRKWSLSEVQAMLAHSEAKVTERYVRRGADMLAEAAASTPGCPGLPMTGSDGSANPPVFSDAPAAIRTRDLSLRKAKRLVGKTRTYEPYGQPVGNLALEVVAEVTRTGKCRRRTLDALALAVLGDAPVQLAFRVLDGGPFALRAALELAGLVVNQASLAPPRTGAR